MEINENLPARKTWRNPRKLVREKEKRIAWLPLRGSSGKWCEGILKSQKFSFWRMESRWANLTDLTDQRKPKHQSLHRGKALRSKFIQARRLQKRQEVRGPQRPGCEQGWKQSWLEVSPLRYTKAGSWVRQALILAHQAYKHATIKQKGFWAGCPEWGRWGVYGKSLYLPPNF